MITAVRPAAAAVPAGTAAPSASGNAVSTLKTGKTLQPGSALVSRGGSHRLVMQGDGNLVLYSGSRALWASQTAGHSRAWAVQQGDGNLVVYAGGVALWSSVTSSFPGAFTSLDDAGTLTVADGQGLVRNLFGSSTLGVDQVLLPGWSLSSPDQRYRLVMQGDGNLVIYGSAGAAWSSGTDGHRNAYLVQQADGNLVIYQHSSALWSSNTDNHPGAMTNIGNDGRLVVVSATGATLWWPGKGQTPPGCNSVAIDPTGSSVTRWNPVVRCVLAMLAQPSGELSDVDTIIEYESGGNPNAVNLTDTNAQEGHPSEGLVQVIRPTFNYYRSPALPNDLVNPAANLYAGLNYAVHNYGSIHNVPGLVSLRGGGGYTGYVSAPAA